MLASRPTAYICPMISSSEIRGAVGDAVTRSPVTASCLASPVPPPRPASPVAASCPASPADARHTQRGARTAHLDHLSFAASGQRLVSDCSAPNPSHIPRPLTFAHANINSITAPGRLDDLEMFANTHNIDIICTAETKLDSNLNTSLYRIDSFSQPLTRHRNSPDYLTWSLTTSSGFGPK